VSGETTRIELKINNLEARLPEASESNLFVLDDNPTIEVLQRPTLEKDEVSQDEASVTELRFSLGNNVRIKSEFLDIKLRGEPQMRIADDLEMQGALQLVPGGRILVLGRRFIVEEGTVLFDTADAADPHLSIAAAWSAPNGVRVRVTVSGTATAPQLTWSSEPALPGGEAEVIALVLGGGGGSTDQGQASITSGIAFAANEALGQTGTDRVQFYTTQETSGTEGRVASLNDSGRESYTATYRISDELWFEGSYEQAEGIGPQNEARSGVSGTLDWRFHPHWSLRSEVGMLGAGLDLVWRYRY
jgi:autotransporter translocation and assembly factor TamB